MLAGLDDVEDKARRERVIRSVLGTAYVGEYFFAFSSGMLLISDPAHQAALIL